MRKIFMFFCGCLLLTACDDVVDLNKAIYREAFLWSDADTILSQNVIDMEWNKDAVSSQAQAMFQFVDAEMQPLSDDYIVKIDGKEIHERTFVADANKKTLELSIGCLPGTEEGRKDGYLLLLSNHTLDRVNDMEVSRGQMPTDYVLHWSFVYDEQMNNIVFGFLVFCLIVLALLVIWFVVLKPVLCPTFGKFPKSFTVLENYQMVLSPRRINMKGCKEFHLTPQSPAKQSTLNRLFTGKIGYLVVPHLKADLVLKPKAFNNKYCYVGGMYSIPTPVLMRAGSMIIKDKRNKIEIKIN